MFDFRNHVGDGRPKPWVQIDCPGCRVALRPSLQRKMSLSDGAWVACYAQRRRRMRPGKPVLTALNVAPVSVLHPCAVQRLVSKGALDAKDHAELLEKLMDDLAKAG